MADYQTGINQQYGRDDLSDKILSALQAAGKDLDALTRDDLSTFDEFHIGGLAETRNLANRIDGLQPGMRVLDVGSGLGGPARTLAAEFGLQVVGLDLTEAYCRAAETLTERVGLNGQITYRQGDALEMPFEDDSFDVVWTQFVGMNIEDKGRLYGQFRRVLRDGGTVAFHEVMAGQDAIAHYPVFWADDATLNFLQPPDIIQQELAENGFEEIDWADLTQHSIEWFHAALAARAKAEAPPVNFSVFVGENTPQKATNVIRNLEEQRGVVVQGVFRVSK